MIWNWSLYDLQLATDSINQFIEIIKKICRINSAKTLIIDFAETKGNSPPKLHYVHKHRLVTRSLKLQTNLQEQQVMSSDIFGNYITKNASILFIPLIHMFS